MRSKVKLNSSEEILKNFTREFLIEEKKRSEIDRFIVDFRILIHKRPHENHNYLNRLLQDYTSMFLSHERISANKLNEDEMKFNLKTQIASRKKNSPKQRYVNSKVLTTNDKDLKHQSYSVLRAKTKDFLKKIKEYEVLEQIAYEIFLKYSTDVYTNQKSKNISEDDVVLKLKSSSTLGDLPIEKPTNLYIVTSKLNTKVDKISPRNLPISNECEISLKNYKYLKDETVKFLHENKNYNEAEQKILSQQYRDNIFIKNYVDVSISSSSGHSIPRKGILSRIKNIIGFSPENTSKFYKNIENENLLNIEKTRIFLKYERKYNNFEFQAYKLFFIENGEFQNPLIQKIQTIAYENKENAKQESITHKTPPEKKIITIKSLVGLKSPKSEILKSNNEKEQFENFNIIKYSPSQNTPGKGERGENIIFNETQSTTQSKENNKSIDEEMKKLKEMNRDFLHEQKIYENEQKTFHEQFLKKHPPSIRPNMKKESLLRKIKQLFKFGKNEKPKEKLQYFKEVTEEFLRNEQYFYKADRPTSRTISESHTSKPHSVKNIDAKMKLSKEKTEEKKTIMKISPVKLHQRSRSEDLLLFKSRTKSSEHQNNKSPTSPKTFSDRLKRMVGIGNRKRTKSREDLSRLIDSIKYFLDQERMNYDLDSEISKKYSRNFNLLSDPANKSTLKTKNNMFLSTENMLYNEQAHLSKNKPPSGRGRKEKRSDKNNKRRSRTLSPAQKLVSKLKNMVSRDNIKTKFSNDGNFIDETNKFIEDHKKFNDSLGGVTIRKIDKEVKLSNTESISIKDEGNSLGTYVNNVTKTLPDLSKVDNFETKKEIERKKEIPNIEKNISLNELNTINEKTMKSPKEKSVRSTTAEETNKFDSPEYIISQARIFLHDMKKYNDLDKEPNVADKTLIFINNKNKSSYHPKDQTLLIDKIQTQPQTIENNAPLSQTSRKMQGQLNNSGINYQREVHSEHKIHPSANSQQFKAHDRSVPLMSSKESSISNKIEKKTVEETMRSEAKFTHETISRTITSHHQKEIQMTNRSTSKITTDKLKSTDNSHPNELSKIPLETSEKDRRKIFNNESLQPHYSAFTEYHDKKQGKIMTNAPIEHPIVKNSSIKNTFPKADLDNSSKEPALKQKKIHEKRNKSGEDIFIESDQLKLDTKQITPQKFPKQPTTSNKSSEKILETKKNQRKENDLKHETHDKKSPILDNNDENFNIMKNLTETFLLEHQDYHHKQNLGYNNSLKKGDQRTNQLSNENKRKENTIASANDNLSSENSRNQLEEFPNQMRVYSNEEKRICLKDNIVWLSDSKDNTYQIRKTSSENSVCGLKHFSTIKQETDAFLRNQKEYQNEQRVEELNFYKKNEKPQYRISSDFAKKGKNNIIEKVKNFLSPKSSRKIAKSHEVNKTLEIKNITQEFLRMHQYLIHREEIELNNPSDITASVANIEQHVYSEVSPIQTHNKVTVNTSSAMKDPVSLMNETSFNKKQIAFIKNETIDFLQNLKNYSGREKENLAKYRINWLSDDKKPSEKLETQTGRIGKIYLTRDMNEKQFSVLKQANKLFLTDNKNYHDKQKVEENNFFDKIEKTRSNVFFTSKKGSIIAEVDKYIKEPHIVIANDFNRISIEQTNEFIQRQRYLIHPDELVFHNIMHSHAKKFIEQKSLPENIQKPKAMIDKTKKGTFSKIKNFMTGGAKSLRNKEDFEQIKKQTRSFLEDHKDYHNNEKVEEHNFIEKREKSQQNIWLTPIKEDQLIKNTPSTLNTEKVPTPYEQEINQTLKEKTVPLLQRNSFPIQTTETISKKQPTEDINGAMTSRESSIRKVENETRTSSSIPQTLKENAICNERESISEKEQTPIFLKNHQYFIHKEETKFNNIHDQHLAEFEKETLKQEEYPELHTSPEEYTTDKLIINKKKTKKGPFTKITDFITGTSKHTKNEEDVALMKKQTEEFLLNLKVYENTEKESTEKYKICWLEKNMKIRNKSSEASIQGKQDQFFIQETKAFLDIHKDYHDTQRVEENNFLSRLDRLQYNVWLTPIKGQKGRVVTKFEDGYSQGPKEIPMKENMIALRNRTADFLKHQQYLIYREEIEFIRMPIDKLDDTIQKINENKTVGLHPTNNVIVDEKKTKKGVFSKLRNFVTGRPKCSPNEELYFLKKQTEKLLSNLRDYGSAEKENLTNNKVIWLSENAKINNKIQLNNYKIAKNENLYQTLKENTISFLEESKTYHDNQKNEENKFMKKHVDIWLVPVKNDQKTMVLNCSPEVSNIPLVQENGFVLRKQTADFLKNHQYLIYRDEIESHRASIQLNEKIVQDKNTRTIAENEKTAADTISNSTSIQKKNKNSALIKIKNFMTGISRHHSNKENPSSIEKETEDLLLNLKQYHSAEKDYVTKTEISWLSENKKKEIEYSMNDNKKSECSYQMLRQKTNSFLEDHKSFHDKQKSEENNFTKKFENLPHTSFSSVANDQNFSAKKITNSFSSEDTKRKPALENNGILRNQTAIFLQNNRYIIYRDVIDDKKEFAQLNQNEVENKVTRKKIDHENSLTLDPMKKTPKETKTKENALARIKNFMKGSSKQSSSKEDLNIMKKQNEEFLLNLKQYNNVVGEYLIKNKVVWISENNQIKNECLSNDAKNQANQYSYQILRQQTINFLEDDKDYHNKQRNEENNFISKLDKLQHISNKTVQKNDRQNIVKKMTNVFSPQKSEQLPSQEQHRILRDQTADFLQNHQYLIHLDEIEFNKVSNQFSENSIKGKVALDNIEIEKVSPLLDSKQSISENNNPSTKTKLFTKVKNLFSQNPQIGNSVFYNVFEPVQTDSKQQTHQFIEREQYHIHEDETNSKKIRKTDYPSKEKISSNNENLQKKHLNSPKKKVTFVEKESPLAENTNTSAHDVEYQHLMHETNSFLKNHKHDQNNQSTVNQETLLRTVKLTQGEHIIKKPNLSNITPSVPSISDELEEPEKNLNKLKKDETDKLPKRNKYLIYEKEISNNNSILRSGNSEKHKQQQNTPIIERNDKSSVETDDESEKTQILIQKTDTFLTDHKLYHEHQWHQYLKFIRKHEKSDTNEESLSEKTIAPKIKYEFSMNNKNLLRADTSISEQNNLSNSDFANNPMKKTIASAPIEETNHEIQQSSQLHLLKQQPETNQSSLNIFAPFSQKVHKEPLKGDNSHVFQLIKQKNIIFLDKELYLIHEDEVNHNKYKPIPKPRKSNHKKESPNKELGVFETNVFLQDHKRYHDEERNAHKNFLSEQNKSKDVSDSRTLSEPKIKQTFFSKLRSLVGNSQPSKVESDSLRKQTLEFIISQKCYNDLEKTAAMNFSEAILCRNKQSILGKSVSEEDNITMLPNEFDELESTSSQVLLLRENLNTISSEHQDQQGKNKQKLGKDSELFSRENVGFLTKQNEDFITFSSTGKEKVHVSPSNGALKTLNNEPQQTSANQKMNKRDIIMKSDCDSESKSMNKSQIHYQYIKKSNQEFLDSQKYFIDTENKLWNSYIKYKPKAVVVKNISQYYGANPTKNTKSKYEKHEKLSGAESEKIDFEINLHKTKIFLQHLKEYNDYQQSFSLKPDSLSPVFQKPNSKPTIKEKRVDVSDEPKTLMSTKTIKNNSHDIEHSQDFPKIDSYPIFPENNKRSLNEHRKVIESSETIHETKFFLKNLQDYHNQERRLIEVSEIPPLSGKKQKKGILSKLKSLAIGKQNKKIQVEVDNTDSVDVVEKKVPFERKLGTKALGTDEEFVIRELESSPTVPKRQIKKKIQAKIPQLEMEEDTKCLQTSESIEPYQDESTTNDVKIDTKSKNFHSARKMKIPIEEEISAKTNIPKDVASIFNTDVKRLYSVQKLQSMEFIIKEKEFTCADISGSIKDDLLESNDVSRNRSGMKSDISKSVTPRTEYSPSAPTIDQINPLPSETEIKPESSVIHRIVSPLSPTKTVFTEIRKRESNPDKTIYILSEGYIINKEESANYRNRKADVIVNETGNIKDPGFRSDGQSRKTQLEFMHENQNWSSTGGINPWNSNRELTSTTPQVQTNFTVQENAPIQHSQGKEYTDMNRIPNMEKSPHFIKLSEMKAGFTGQVKSQIKNENDYSPPTRPSQEKFEVTRAREHTKSYILILLIILGVVVAIMLGRENDDEKY